jgi:hypothetical protein
MCLVRTRGVPVVRHKYLSLVNVKRGLAYMQISPLQGSRVTHENDTNLQVGIPEAEYALCPFES